MQSIKFAIDLDINNINNFYMHFIGLDEEYLKTHSKEEWIKKLLAQEN